MPAASLDSWLSRTLARQLDAHDLDVEAAVDATLAEIAPERLLDVARAALTVWARLQVGRMRSARFRAAYRERTKPFEGDVFRIPINVGDVKRMVWIGECTRTDLLLAAERLERLAQADLERAAAYRRLADAMAAVGAEHVRDVDEQVVRAALTDAVAGTVA